MAQHTIVTMVDDITNEPGEDVKGLDFAFDGKAYEIDLSDVSRAAFGELLAPYIGAARKATAPAPRASGGKRGSGGSRPSGGAKPVSAEKAASQAARAWAVSNGESVSERGRLPGDLLARWEAAGRPGLAEQTAAPAAQDAVSASDSVTVTVSPDASAEPTTATEEAPKRGRRGRAATTPTRPDATAPADEFAAAQS